MFDPPVAMASLSGASDADWARTGAPWVGAAFLGGIAICEATRDAARQLVDRDREEFLPSDPVAFIDDELDKLDDVVVHPGVNVRAVDREAIPPMATVCARHDAIYEVNAHCRQDELCAVGAGESLLADTDRLAEQVTIAGEAGATVSAKVRTEVPDVDLVETAIAIENAGASAIHVDAMDSEHRIADIVDRTSLFVIANNGVRGPRSVAEYLDYGADAVSVGRPSDRPVVLEQVYRAVQAYEPTREVLPTSNDR